MKNNSIRKNIFRLYEPLIITVFWILLFTSPFIMGNYSSGIDWTHVFRIWLSFIPYLLIFLINRFLLLPYLFLRNKRLHYISSAMFLVILMSIGVYHFQNELLPRHRQISQPEMMPINPGSNVLPPPGINERPGPRPGQGPRLGPRSGPKPLKELPPYIAFVIISILIIGFDTGLKLSVKWVESEQKRVSAEKENMESQLAFLRNQVSPHFFMNTLNNIHSLIDIDSEEAKESIIRLSKLMRHLLYDSEADKIPIHKEIEFIKNYVDLMKLRYSDKVKIDLHLPVEIPDRSIPPLLFTSFVENAFKHGISYQSTSFIDVSFSYSPENLSFEIKNSISKLESEDKSPGIGIENSRKRLDLIYGDNYTLKIENRGKEHVVYLSIPL